MVGISDFRMAEIYRDKWFALARTVEPRDPSGAGVRSLAWACWFVKGVANLLACRRGVNSICLVQWAKTRPRILCNLGHQATHSVTAAKAHDCAGLEGWSMCRKNLIHSRAGFPQQEHRKCRKTVAGPQSSIVGADLMMARFVAAWLACR